MVAACPATAGQFQSGSCSRLRDYNDIFSLRAFLTLSDFELDFLTLGQRLEACTLNCAEMCKHVWTRFLCNESIAFGLIEPLNCSAYCI